MAWWHVSVRTPIQYAQVGRTIVSEVNTFFEEPGLWRVAFALAVSVGECLQLYASPHGHCLHV